ncbi:hypothetical protein [Variovorax sp. PBS-H4]|uniref:hypothetical protein n=1 Tax=Variovorax sp. PBS-H4 TaxID=434008 RepID=UPI0013A53278|nr:hypothetical protein [Variovorax sp. PBS-H4]
MKKVASARPPSSDEQSSIDGPFDGSSEALRMLVQKEIEIVRASANARGIQLPMNLAADDGDQNSKAGSNPDDDHQRDRNPQGGVGPGELKGPDEVTLERITRISYNSAGWHHPTGEAATQEHSKTYNSINGFGHEDWLFRNEWTINGWRYAFIQGVSKSRKALVKTLQPVDLTLFTVDSNKRRRYVAYIREAEALDDQQADAAVYAFRQAGWLATMQNEIAAVGGEPAALGNARWASHILNVRFKVENLTQFPPEAYAQAGDPILQLNRYQLYKVAPSPSGVNSHTRAGCELPPTIRSFIRKGSAAREVSPEHAKMQAQLMWELQNENPDARVVREQDYIDVLVETGESIFLYEIKSDLSPRSVLRQAIGQLLEYSHRMPNPDRKTVTLIAVGRSPLSEGASDFLQNLQQARGLPLAYRVVKI